MARQKTAKLQRSEVVTVRFDPRLRYLVELAARKQRRTVSSFLEWAAEQAINEVTIGTKVFEDEPGFPRTEDVSAGDWADLLWDVDRPDRLAKLGQHFPELLTYDEQIIWKRIQEDAEVWHGGAQLDFPLMRSRWARYVEGVSRAAEEE
ncbi:hypothetical protein [Paraburkholderia youngii]|uniref:hypothetical protein n=1 Tax=Paraburkholderia youngii TaxID=2782701 RepID=UPI003D25EFFE